MTPGTRILGASIGLLATLLAANLWLGLRTARWFADEVQQAANRSMAMYIADRGPLIREGRVDHERMTEIAGNAMVLNPAATIYLLDESGRVIWPAPSGVAPARRVALDPVFRFLDGPTDRAAAIYGNDPRSGNRHLFSAAAIDSELGREGFVYVVLGTSHRAARLADALASHALRYGAAGLLALLIVAILLLWGISAWLTRPLNRLYRSILEVERELLPQVGPGNAASAEDFRRVQQAFDAMAGRLREQVKDLRGTDLVRRELFAQASHDLRTPLSAMRGYVETLATDSADMGAGQRREFIAVILKQCDRLQRLVDQVFTLARLDLAALPLQPEPVALADLMHDIVAQRQQVAREAGVRLTVSSAPQVPAVMADIALMETVAENLLDNALRHCRSGRQTHVSVEVVAARVRVTIRDEGPGIDPGDLHKVLQPFYAGAGGRTGLGLSIVQRVLALHQSRLDLASIPGQGTLASFELPALKSVCRDDFVTSGA
jgi:signal transduction histidine kinase